MTESRPRLNEPLENSKVQALNARYLSKDKGCHSCCSIALAKENGKTASKEEAKKLDTQLSF
ncbi:MAG: hypothetical protein ABIN04_05425 [Ginsengibacter sp.]